MRVKEDLRSLCRASHSYDPRRGRDASLLGFLEQARVEPATVLGAEEDTISTIHGAKGAEARVVFLLGCEERLLPIFYAIDSQGPAADRGGTSAVLSGSPNAAAVPAAEANRRSRGVGFRPAPGGSVSEPGLDIDTGFEAPRIAMFEPRRRRVSIGGRRRRAAGDLVV